MENIIQIRNLTFGYEESLLFDHFNMEIKKGSFTTIAGPIGSGKSTLMRILLGLKRADANIHIAGYQMCGTNIGEIRKNIGVVFENPDNQFVAETVADDLAFSLENLSYTKDEIMKNILRVGSDFGIEHLFDKGPHELSGGEKQIVALASALILNPKILILDEAMTMIDEKEKKHIFQLLLNYHKKKHITILQVTHDLEDALYGDDILILSEGKIVIHDKKEVVLKEEKLLRKIGLELPFMASLSLKLNYYGLVDDTILDMDEMVNLLWK